MSFDDAEGIEDEDLVCPVMLSSSVSVENESSSLSGDAEWEMIM